MAIPAGARLGPYEVVSTLGVGGMGEVYRARDARIGRDVAVKVLAASARNDPERLRRFEREARAVGALSHPNVLAIYDVGEHDGAPYVVTELLEGQTLGERLQGGPLPARKATEYARQIAEGLAAAHDKGIVHRDLKPHNVFVTRDGHVKLLDFGLARLLNDGESQPDEAATMGRVLGTVGYMSPEQVRGEAADPRSDIFSFGAILYEMLAGRRAFQGKSAVETMNGILKDEPPEFEPSPVGPHAALERIVWHCLEKSPGERFQSARDLAFDLDALSSLSLPPLSGLRGRSTRRTWLYAAAVFLAGLVAGALALALWPRPPSRAPAFQRITFRRGTIESARFAPDGQGVVYGAAWAGEPVRVFVSQLGGPESRPLGFESTELLGLSHTGEMALSLGRRRTGTFVGTGTLARAALAGGAPREVLEDVMEADFAPDSGFAIVRSVAGRHRLEYPIGRVLYESAGFVSHPRFAPAGDRIAFLDHPVWGDDGGHVALIDLAGHVRRLARNWSSVSGLAWRPDGREIWFAGTREGAARALHAVDLDGREREIARMAGALTLHDVSPDGRVLLTHQVLRREILAHLPGGVPERDLSWMDYSFPSDLSDDGSTLLFAENGEGGGRGYAVYVRRTDGSPAVRLSSGAAMSLSPDKKWVLANADYMSDAPQLNLVPAGTGDVRALPRAGLRTQAAVFFPDARRILLTAAMPDHATRTYVQDLEGAGAPLPLTPEGTRFTLGTKPIAPDGRRVLLRDADGNNAVYDTQAGARGPAHGLDAADQAIRWHADGQRVFTYRPGELPARVSLVDLATGTRVPWVEIAPSDRAGIVAITPVLLTPNGDGYVYGYRRVLSDLYVVSGLE